MDSENRKGKVVRLLLLCLAVFYAASCSAAEQKGNVPAPPAVARIPVDAFGYMAPNSFYLTSRLSSMSLDFIDKDHLLFTFRIPGLMKRLPDNQPDDDDQTIRAVVLELPSGNITAKAEWRMHDRGRYLWRIKDGKFLVRRRNSLFMTDRTLELTPYMESHDRLESVQFSADRKWMAVEMQGTKNNEVASTSPTLGEVAPEQKIIRVFVFDAETGKAIGRSETQKPVEITMVGDGHMMTASGKRSSWLIRYEPFKGEPRTVTEVESRCDPSQLSLSTDVVLVVGCAQAGYDHEVTAVNLDGKKLWKQVWESRYIWPTFQLSEDGSRFAYSSLQASHPLSAMSPIDDSTIEAQMVGVFDTQTGYLRLVKNATPVLSAGQNYALSPDGLRFAVLREGAIEVYDLPPVSAPGAPPVQPSGR